VPDPPSLGLQSGEHPAVGDRADHAERRRRPLARRAFSTARPLRVAIRWRNPCLRERRRLFGWNVRFTHASSAQAGSVGRRQGRPVPDEPGNRPVIDDLERARR
jgi:hypothetical protein